MLKLILGRSGSGKTQTIRELLAKLVQEHEEKLMLLVPEQFSFESERAMLRLLGPREAGRVQVVSFTRLCDLVFRTYGGFAGKRLDDGGRAILMSLALEEVKEQLNLYRRQASSIDMVGLMLSAATEFKMCAISPDDLLQASAGAGDGTLQQKLRETALILSAYDALVARSFLDPLDDLTRLSKALSEHRFFEGYTVFLDSFKGFTAQELLVLEPIFKQSKEVTVALCADGLDDPEHGLGLFSGVRHTARALLDLARKNGVPVARPVVLEKGHRFLSTELCELESGIFRREHMAFSEPAEHISLYAAPNPYEESEYVARTIRRLVMDEGYAYRDFTVIARKTEGYAGILDTTLAKYDIPVFMDRPEPIDAKPLMNLALTAFDILKSSYASDDIFRYLKTGLAGLSAEETAELENYALLWKISGKKWLEEWAAHPDGFVEDFTESHKIRLQAINKLRIRVIAPLSRFAGRVRDADGMGIAKALYLLLEDIGAARHLRELCDGLSEQGELNLAQEQLRLWDLFMSILDQTALVLKDVQLPYARFAELLRVVITSNSIADIPQGLDEVTVGAADRMRPAQPKAVFVIGAAEGEFPAAPAPSGLFSDSERRRMIALNIPLSDSAESLAVEERFLAYTALTSPSERLYVSYSVAGEDGSPKTPSIILKEIASLFPNLTMQDDFLIPTEDTVCAERPAFELAARLWKQEGRVSDALKEIFVNRVDYAPRLAALERASSGKPAAFYDPSRARALFGAHMHLSASQVEKFHLCRFQYFCRYGLNAKERRPAEMDALEYGSLMHFLLERMLRKYKKGICSLTRPQVREEIEELLTEYIENKLGGSGDKSPRFTILFTRLKQTATVLVLHIAKEFAQSEFEPAAFELSIGREGDLPPLELCLPGGETVSVEGKVDRVDLLRRGDESYVRVVDYKTGTKDFKLSDVLYGLNMQMLIYLAAIWQNGQPMFGNVKPAGVLYMPANRPSVSLDRGAPPEKVELEAQKKLRMNGLVLDDPAVIEGMEKNAAGVFIPVTLKDGKPARRDSVASLAQMGAITGHIERLIAAMAGTLQNGDIAAVPVKGDYDACAWCPYRPVCGYEEGGPAVEMQKWDRDEVLKQLGSPEQKEGEAL